MAKKRETDQELTDDAGNRLTDDGGQKLTEQPDPTHELPPASKSAIVEDALVDFAGDLGRLLGATQAKASGWLAQRQTVADQLIQIRDTATKLLGDLGHSFQQTVAHTAPKKGGRPAGSKNKPQATGARRGRPPKAQAAPQGKKRKGVSDETRQKMAEAKKRYWAERKAGQG